MTESDKHKKLKEIAQTMLVDKGFKITEIYEEYKLPLTGTDKKRRFVIDVVGISKDKKIAIELGTVDAKKLAQLELFFDEVIHIPYGVSQCTEINFELISELKQENDGLHLEIEQLNKINKQQKRVIDDYRSKPEWNKNVEQALNLINAVKVGLIESRKPYDAFRISKNSYSHYSRFRNSLNPNYEIILEKIYRALFEVDDDNLWNW